MKNKKRFTHAYTVLLILAVLALVPVMLIVSAAFSAEDVVSKAGYRLLIHSPTLEPFRYLLKIREFGNTIIIYALITVMGTALSLAITAMLAYAMAKPDFPWRKQLTAFVALSLAFAGTQGSYDMWKIQFGVTNTVWSILLPNYLVSGVFALILRTYYRCAVPWETLEAARLDGASDLTAFLKILLPQSKPALATVGFFTALNYWNDWENTFHYLRNGKLRSVSGMLDALTRNGSYFYGCVPHETLPCYHTLRMAYIILCMIPVVIAFLFARPYLIQGARIGNSKR